MTEQETLNVFIVEDVMWVWLKICLSKDPRFNIVSTAKTLKEAQIQIDELKRNNKRVDIALVDWDFPDGTIDSIGNFDNGPKVVELISTQFPDATRIGISSRGDLPETHGNIPKPFLSDFLERLNLILNSVREKM